MDMKKLTCILYPALNSVGLINVTDAFMEYIRKWVQTEVKRDSEKEYTDVQPFVHYIRWKRSYADNSE